MQAGVGQRPVRQFRGPQAAPPGLAHELGYQELSMIGLVYRP